MSMSYFLFNIQGKNSWFENSKGIVETQTSDEAPKLRLTLTGFLSLFITELKDSFRLLSLSYSCSSPTSPFFSLNYSTYTVSIETYCGLLPKKKCLKATVPREQLRTLNQNGWSIVIDLILDNITVYDPGMNLHPSLTQPHCSLHKYAHAFLFSCLFSHSSSWTHIFMHTTHLSRSLQVLYDVIPDIPEQNNPSLIWTLFILCPYCRSLLKWC